MKKMTWLALATLWTVGSSCSSDDNDNNVVVPPVSSGYAMTAKINGVVFEANNPFGNNEFSETNIWNYYPEGEYIMLQGRKGGVVGNPEINLWLKLSDMQVGSYAIGAENYGIKPSHYIDLIDNSNDQSEQTKDGTIVITEVNPATHTVKGNFVFRSVDEEGGAVNFNVTEGTFHYTTP